MLDFQGRRSGIFSLYRVYAQNPRFYRGNRGFTINLKEKSLCSDEQSTEIRAPISPISPVISKHTPGFPSREGMLYGAKGLEFPKNSPWGWVGLEQALSRVLCSF